MIPLNHIVDVEGPPTSAIPAQLAGVFPLYECGRVRRMPIDVDNARLNPPRLRESKLEKALRRRGIAEWREQEINGIAGRVDGAISICPPTGNADVGSSTRHERFGFRISDRIRWFRTGAYLSTEGAIVE